MNENTFSIRHIVKTDFEKWLPLWVDYNTFYKKILPLEVTTSTWNRFLNESEPMFALVATEGDQIIGLSHYLFHRNTGMVNDVCYLQDLFTVPSARNRGVAKALIEAVYQKAKQNGSARIYWQTHESNSTARNLYDKVGENSGFIVYRKL